MEDDRNAQRDEILAIESIYPDLLAFNGESRVQFDLSPIKLVIDLPPRYPSEELPVIELSGPTLTIQQKNKLWNLLNEECLNNLGMPLMFSIITVTKDFIEAENLVVSNAEVSGGNDNESKIENTVTEPQEPELDIKHGEVLTDRKSHFQAHLYPVKSKEEVTSVIRQLMRNNKIARATHNMVAWRIRASKDGKEISMHDCDDDGESGASSKMLELLEKMGAENVVVVVSRWYGGIQLGPDRFRHINNVTREILAAHGYEKRTKD